MYCPVCHTDYPGDWKVCPKDATNLLRSTQLGKYTIDGLLGVGGMGAVYRALNPGTNATVAIKVMNPSVAGAEMARARFQREAAAVSKLTTKHVCQVFDFGEEADGTLYLVMELMRGHPLRDEITPAPAQMPLARVQMVIDGALRGLHAAHKAGIVHRDLKPENIFVADTDDGEVPKILDFGIARVRTRESDLTGTGVMMGTATYMAPEQVGGSRVEIGAWTDVYAMGTILYELLTGIPAIGGDTITDVLSRVVTSRIEPLAQVRPGLPQAIYDLVARCTAADPTQRPRDAEELRTAFNAARLVAPGTPIPDAKLAVRGGDLGQQKTEGVSTKTPSSQPPVSAATRRSRPDPEPPRTPPPPEPPPQAKSRLPLVLAGVAVLGLGAFAIAKLTGGGAKPPPDAAPVVAIVGSAPADAARPADAAIAAFDAAPAPSTDMVAFPAGEYQIGEKGARGDELPARKVRLGAFAIDKHEMTVGELTALLGTVPDQAKGDAATTPARFVDFATAERACKARHARLPSEAEWEAAALSTPQDPNRARLLRKNALADLTDPSTDCSAAGLCDMLGSLTEWTADDFAKRPGMKVVRGASYRVPPAKPGTEAKDTIHLRVAFDAKGSDNTIGFRCAMETK